MFYAILVFANYVLIAHSSCPFMRESLSVGEYLFQKDFEMANTLRHDGINISKPQPGWSFYIEQEFPPKLMGVMHNASMMMITEQYYAQKYLSGITKQQLTDEERIAELASLSECIPKDVRCRPKPDCDPNDIYRTYDGTCNNLKYPNDGASRTQYHRLIQGVYNDGLHELRRSLKTSAPLVSPRIIANTLYSNPPYKQKPKQRLNIVGVFIGQSIAHDSGHLINTGAGIDGSSYRCCSADYTVPLPKNIMMPECSPIDIPRDDAYYSQYNMTCMEFIRAQLIHQNDCKLGQAHKISMSTTFLDVSYLYGHAQFLAHKFRTFKGGQLITDKYDILREQPNCIKDCYLIADARQFTAPTLLLQQSVLLRFHNYLAQQLLSYNPHWDDQKLFQEARRILIAVVQNIVIKEWLKVVIGDKYFQRHFACEGDGYCGSYDPNLIPGTLAEFSQAALRLLHILVPGHMNFNLNATYTYQVLPVSELINRQKFIAEDYLSILRGSLFQPCWLKDFPIELRNQAFVGYDDIGFDLSSIDIARARDFGIAPYYQYMEFCEPGVHNIQDWDDLEPNISHENIKLLKTLYDSVHDVDINPGLYLERKDGYLGPVSRCIFASQFYRSIHADRFFYSFKNSGYPFTPNQLRSIHKITFSRVLCQVTDVQQVPQQGLLVPSDDNPIVDCGDMPAIDLIHWKEKIDV